MSELGVLSGDLARGKRHRALVVDDDPDTRSLVRVALERKGFDVYGLADGAGALDAALALEPDVVVLDWVLQDCSGLEVCSAIRSRQQLDRTGIVMITARRHDGDRWLCYGAGADRFVTKPLSPPELAGHVQQLLIDRLR